MMSVSLGYSQDVPDDSIVLLPESVEAEIGDSQFVLLSENMDLSLALIEDARFKRAPALPKLAVRGLGRLRSSKGRKFVLFQ